MNGRRRGDAVGDEGVDGVTGADTSSSMRAAGAFFMFRILI
jgi:hypothetical protein